MPIKSKTKVLQDLAFLLILSSIFMLFRLGSGSLASWDEALYATVSKEILKSGQWFNFSYGGLPWLEKPPLCLWMTAVFFKIFGICEFAARIFSALCGIGAVVVTYFFGRELFGRWVGFLSAMVLLSSSHFFHFARFGMMDAPLTFFMLCAFYLFWLGHQKNRFLIFSGIAVGLAVMAKGPVALLIFPVIAVYCWLADDLEILSRSSYWIGVMIAVGIALPWHLYQMIAAQDLIVKEVMDRHLLERMFFPVEGRLENFYFYIRVFVNKYHPWVLVGIISAPFFLVKAIKDREPEVIFVTVWIFFIFFALTIAQTKRNWYLLPVYPAISMSVAYVLAKVFDENQRHFVRAAFLVIMALHIPYSHVFEYDYSGQIKGIAPWVKEKTNVGSPLYLYNQHEAPAVYFYMDRPSIYLDTKEEFYEALSQAKEFNCLIRRDDFEKISTGLPPQGLVAKASYKDYLLISRSKAKQHL